VDNRPTALAQRKLAETMKHSPRVLQQRALSNAIHNTPQMMVQRHEMNALFGGAVRPQGGGAMSAELSPAPRADKPNNSRLPNLLKSGIESLSITRQLVEVTLNRENGKPFPPPRAAPMVPAAYSALRAIPPSKVASGGRGPAVPPVYSPQPRRGPPIAPPAALQPRLQAQGMPPLRPSAGPRLIQAAGLAPRARKATKPFVPNQSGMESQIHQPTLDELKADIPGYDEGAARSTNYDPNMRKATAPFAASYGVYHLADMATLGLISDANWYWAATRRSTKSKPMSTSRAAIGFAGTAAVKLGAGCVAGAAAAAVLPLAGAGLPTMAGAAALGTRVGRWLYDRIDSGVAELGPASALATNYERHVLGETIKTSGQVAVVAKRNDSRQTKAAMGNESASEHAGRLRKNDVIIPGLTNPKHHYEWTHLVGDSLGGATAWSNLVAASYHANTEMMPMENAVRLAADAGDAMAVNVTAFCVEGTDIAKRINYKIYKNSKKVFEKTIDATRGPVSAPEYAVLSGAVSAAIKGGVWGTLRSVVGPR